MKMFHWLQPRSAPLKLTSPPSGRCNALAYNGFMCIHGEPLEVQRGARLPIEITRELVKKSCPRECIAIRDEWWVMSKLEEETWPPELRNLPFHAAPAKVAPAKVARAIRRWYPDDVGLVRVATWLEAQAARGNKLEFYTEAGFDNMGCPVALDEDHE